MNDTTPRTATRHRAHDFAVVAIAAWSGFFVMAVELLGARMLAPNFGNSIYVWGGVITVFMIGLAIGYLLGGQYSLRQPSLGRLASLQLLAAATLVPVLLFGGPVLDELFVLIEDPRWGSIAGSAVIFLVPTIISGMVSPYAVRLLVEDSRTSGRLSGLLFFFSTFGSAAGTLLTSFYLVLVLEINQLLWSLIGISVVVSGGILLASRRWRAPA
ncbi:MAG: fused MFS/spermidine synthase [Steroidobacteraceae bacterium]|nr:fused MFS/spermidine synthase [Steroidobacteraceae bacterium]